MGALHPQAQAVLDGFAAMKLTPPDQLPVEQARAQFMQSRARFLMAPQPVGSIVDRSIPGAGSAIPLRIYRPYGSPPNAPLPALVFMHGGGWVFGNLDSHDPMCRELCNLSGCALVSVDYRLAPEHKFPAAFDDALAAIRYLASEGASLGVDGTRLAAGGDSAGGNLAAAAAIAFRDQGGPRLALQLLIYPVTDLAMDTPSYAAFADGYMLTAQRMRYFRDCYLSAPGEADDWRASPLRAGDLSRLPPALIITASHDPLVDEGRRYAERLDAAGVPATYTCYDGMVHGFMTMAGAIEDGRAAIRQAAAAVKAALRGTS
jgi:acetyl esterase